MTTDAPGGFPSGYLAEHPLPAGILGALSLTGYQLLADVAGVGAGRLGAHAFLLIADDAMAPAASAGSGAQGEPHGESHGGPQGGLQGGLQGATHGGPQGATHGGPQGATHLSLHQSGLRDERDALAYVQLAAQLGFLRLSGYRLALERAGLRSRINVVNPATGGIVLAVPEKHPGRLFGSSRGTVSALLAAARALRPAGPPPDLQSPELLRQLLLSMALSDDALGGAEAVETADRALELLRSDSGLDPARALEAAKSP